MNHSKLHKTQRPALLRCRASQDLRPKSLRLPAVERLIGHLNVQSLTNRASEAAFLTEARKSQGVIRLTLIEINKAHSVDERLLLLGKIWKETERLTHMFECNSVFRQPETAATFQGFLQVMSLVHYLEFFDSEKKFSVDCCNLGVTLGMLVDGYLSDLTERNFDSNIPYKGKITVQSIETLSGEMHQLIEGSRGVDQANVVGQGINQLRSMIEADVKLYPLKRAFCIFEGRRLPHSHVTTIQNTASMNRQSLVLGAEKLLERWCAIKPDDVARPYAPEDLPQALSDETVIAFCIFDGFNMTGFSLLETSLVKRKQGAKTLQSTAGAIETASACRALMDESVITVYLSTMLIMSESGGLKSASVDMFKTMCDLCTAAGFDFLMFWCDANSPVLNHFALQGCVPVDSAAFPLVDDEIAMDSCVPVFVDVSNYRGRVGKKRSLL